MIPASNNIAVTTHGQSHAESQNNQDTQSENLTDTFNYSY